MSGFGEHIPPGALSQRSSAEGSKPQKPSERQMPQTASQSMGGVTVDQKRQNSQKSQSSSADSMAPKASKPMPSGFGSRSPPSLPLKGNRPSSSDQVDDSPPPRKLSSSSFDHGQGGEKPKKSGDEKTRLTIRIGKPKPSSDKLKNPRSMDSQKRSEHSLHSKEKFSSKIGANLSMDITTGTKSATLPRNNSGRPSLDAEARNDPNLAPKKRKKESSESGDIVRSKDRRTKDTSDAMDVDNEYKKDREDGADRRKRSDGVATDARDESTPAMNSKVRSEIVDIESIKSSRSNNDRPKQKQGRTRSSSFDTGDMISEDALSDRGERASLGGDQRSSLGAEGSAGGGREKAIANNRDVDAALGLAGFKESAVDGQAGRLPNVANIKEPSGATATTPSFLEALSEEERRVRTRHLPAVDGIRRLHKSEIKRDLAMARSINSLSLPGRSGKGRRSNSVESSSDKDKMKKMDLKYDDRRMDVDEDGTGVSDEGTTSDMSAGGGRASNRSSGSDVSDIGPCSAFVPPKDDILSLLSGGKTASTGDNSDSKGTSADGHVRPHPPHVVESITAFNPPRPKESIGSKKKHRLIRWERNPQVVEVELSNHRKTVQRVREELHNIEHERERVEAIGSHLRVHFMNHLKALREESVVLNQELSSIQVDCVKAAELLTSKTRSKGMGKGSHVMRDVLSILKTRGTKLTPQQGTETFGSATNSKKIRGHCWTLPGDRVSTPLGDGVVLHVYGPSVVDVNAPNPEGVSFKSKAIPNTAAQAKKTSAFSSFVHKAPMQPGTPHRHGFGGTASSVPFNQQRSLHNIPANPLKQNQQHTNHHAATAPGTVPSGSGFASGNREGSTPNAKNDSTNAQGPKDNHQKGHVATSSSHQSKGSPKPNKEKLCLIHPRICVRTGFGVAYLSPSDVICLEDPSTYTDQKLLSRWKKMVESAKVMGGCVESDSLDEESCQTLGISSRMTTLPAMCMGDSDLHDSNAIDIVGGRKGNPHENSRRNEDGGATTMGIYSKNEVGDNEVRMPADEPSSSKDSTDFITEKSSLKNGEKNGGKRQKQKGLVPFGSGMLPTPGIYGGMLSTLPLDVLERNLDQTVMTGNIVLGTPSNPSVPPVLKQWEAQRYDTYQLKGKVLQLRNELYRQRRIRILNERSYTAGKERSDRVEGLLLEMKADLKSLKDRLQDELEELGIDQEKASDMLGAHLNEDDFDDEDEAYRAKRQTETPDGSVISGTELQRSNDSMEGMIVTGHKQGAGEYHDGDSRLGSEPANENDGTRKSQKRARNDGDSTNSGLDSGNKSKRSFRT